MTAKAEEDRPPFRGAVPDGRKFGIDSDAFWTYRSGMATDDLNTPFPFNSPDEWDNHPRFKPLTPTLDAMSSRTFGMTHAEAVAQKVCIRCKRSVYDRILLTVQDVREWRISGVCGLCWADLFPDEDDGS